MSERLDRVVVDARQLRAACLRPPVSKSDAQRALTLAYALDRPDLAVLDEAEDDLPTDVRVLRRGLEALRTEGATIDCADGGAPLRILLGQAAALPNAHVRFVGSARLGDRPHAPLLAALRAAGVELRRDAAWPIELWTTAPARSPFVVSGAESSQYVTSLVLAAAALVARAGSPARVDVAGPIASGGYLALTLRWLGAMGFVWAQASDGSITVTSAHPPSAAPPLPGDWSSIAYLALVAWASGSTVERVDLDAPHPDRAILDLLAMVGLEVTGALAIRGEATRGLEVSGQECPDLLPTLAVLACVLPAPSLLRDVSILRHKESDRVAAIEALVIAGGARCITEGDTLRIEPGRVPGSLAIDSHGDHRVAMAAAVLAVLGRATLSLDGASCVDKSFPSFFRELARVGVETRLG